MVENRFDITDRIVIITGAGQGIGRSCAHAFADAETFQEVRQAFDEIN